jgi:hypothetical protein
MPPPRSSGGGRSRRRLRSPRALTAATIQGRVPCRTSGAPPTRPGAAITRPTSWWVTVRYARRGRNAPRRSRGRARGDSRLGQGPPARDQRGSPAVAAAHRPAPRAPTTRGVAHTVACHAEGAGLPEDRGTPHVLRHTVCTHRPTPATSEPVAAWPAPPTPAPPRSTSRSATPASNTRSRSALASATDFGEQPRPTDSRQHAAHRSPLPTHPRATDRPRIAIEVRGPSHARNKKRDRMAGSGTPPSKSVTLRPRALFPSIPFGSRSDGARGRRSAGSVRECLSGDHEKRDPA